MLSEGCCFFLIVEWFYGFFGWLVLFVLFFFLWGVGKKPCRGLGEILFCWKFSNLKF